jgi:hypothetical protein
MPDLNLTDIAAAVGLGLFAGAAGTAAMTVSSSLEAKLSDRGGSTAPSDAAGKVLGVQPRDPQGQARFSNVVHWTYGTAWGAARGLIGLAAVRDGPATAVHFGAVWGWSLVMLPALRVSPPAWEQRPKQLAVDAFHHVVYASATTLAWRRLA